jgi:hypothetical protein
MASALELDLLLSARRIIEDRKSYSARSAIKAEVPLSHNHLGGRLGHHFVRSLECSGCIQGNGTIHDYLLLIELNRWTSPERDHAARKRYLL